MDNLYQSPQQPIFYPAPAPPVKKSVKFGSIVLGLIVVFIFGTLITMFLYKGKKAKAKQRKNDQKFTLKQTSQSNKQGGKDGKQGEKSTTRTQKNAKATRKSAPKQQPTKGGNTVNLKRA